MSSAGLTPAVKDFIREHIQSVAQIEALDLVQSALDALLRYRVQRMKPTFGTTNLDPGEFSGVFGKSITSLFKEAMQSVHVPGDDFRDGVFDERHPTSNRPTAPGSRLW